MAKDSLSEALFELKDKSRRSGMGDRTKRPRKKRLPRGRPKAFDSFYLFAQILLGLALILQLVAFFVYA